MEAVYIMAGLTFICLAGIIFCLTPWGKKWLQDHS